MMIALTTVKPHLSPNNPNGMIRADNPHPSSIDHNENEIVPATDEPNPIIIDPNEMKDVPAADDPNLIPFDVSENEIISVGGNEPNPITNGSNEEPPVQTADEPLLIPIDVSENKIFRASDQPNPIPMGPTQNENVPVDDEEPHQIPNYPNVEPFVSAPVGRTHDFDVEGNICSKECSWKL